MKRFWFKIIKRILGLTLIVGCSGAFLNSQMGVGEPVHAQNQNEGTTGTSSFDTMSFWQILNMLLKVVYLFLRPLLVVAGLALDNTLVYASVFHMDAPLRKFWNMMKNFANFALGFMVLFAIIKSILTNSGQGSLKDEKSPLGIIKNTLIAGVLIQASWFLMAALIDVSTIATYAVGGLPLNVLKDNDIANTRILTVSSELDLDKFDIATAGGKGFKVRYTTDYGEPKQKLHVSPCRVEQEYVIGRESGDPKFRNVEKIAASNDSRFKGKEVCVLFGKIFVLRDEDKVISDIKSSAINSIIANTGSYTGGSNAESAYDNIMKSMLTYNSGAWTGLNITGNMVHVWNNSGYINTGKAFFDATSGVTLANIIKESKGFVGPLVTLYSSLLNFAQLSNTEIGSIGATSGIFLIKTGVAIALFFPLLALAVVLIARIGYLWLFIVASPFIIIKSIFSNFLKLGEKIDGYLSIKTVVGIVFAPVITVAALSLSLIFMSVLTNRLSPTNPSAQTRFDESFNISRIESTNNDEGDTFDFLGIAQFQFSKLARGESMDRFSWLLINFFAIALLWMIVFAAIKSNKLGEKIGGDIEKFGSNVFQTIPILPVPGSNTNVGVGSMYKGLAAAPDMKLEQLQQADNDVVRKRLGEDKDEDKDKNKDKGSGTPSPITNEQATGIVQTLSTIPAGSTAKNVVENYLKEQNITTPIATLGTAGATELYAAVNTQLGTLKNQTDKTNLVTNFDAAFGSGTYKTQAEADIKKNITITATTTENEIPTLLAKSEVKTALDNYFTYADPTNTTGYVITSADNKKTLTITKDASGNYTGALADVVSTPPNN